MKRKHHSIPAVILLGLLAFIALDAAEAFAEERHQLDGNKDTMVRNYEETRGYAHGSDRRGPVYQIREPFRPVRPGVVYENTYVPGRYEVRSETVLVEPGHYLTRWAPPLIETRYGRFGRPYQVVVRQGYQEKVWVPDRYETRVVKVWVPGHHVVHPTVAYQESHCQVSYPKPYIPHQEKCFNLGVSFGF